MHQSRLTGIGLSGLDAQSRSCIVHERLNRKRYVKSVGIQLSYTSCRCVLRSVGPMYIHTCGTDLAYKSSCLRRSAKGGHKSQQHEQAKRTVQVPIDRAIHAHVQGRPYGRGVEGRHRVVIAEMPASHVYSTYFPLCWHNVSDAKHDDEH